MNAKPFLCIALFLLFAFSGKAQLFDITNFSGTALYGSRSITVTSAGSVTTYSDPCLLTPTTYWIGPGGGGSYTYTISAPVYRVDIRGEGLNGGTLGAGEYVQVYINGSPYTLTAADMASYSVCGSGAGPCYLYTGFQMGPLGSSGDYNGAEILINYPLGVTSVQVYCNGTLSGYAYHIKIDTVRPVSALNNHPCFGDTLKLNMLGDSTGATYYWYGPLGFTSTLQDPFIYPAVYADTGVYHCIRNISGVLDTESTHVLIKPLPVITATSNSPICQGAANTLTLFANPDSTGETFSWSGPNTFSSTLEDPIILGFTAADSGTYKVIATWNGCTDSATTHVILAPIPPAPVISGDTVYCSGNTFVPFTVAAAGSILWYTTGAGGTSSAAAPVVNTSYGGHYTFWATQTILGCESLRDSISVTVHVTPAPPAITGPTTFCQYLLYTPPAVTGTNILWYTVATGGAGVPTAPMVNTNYAGISNFWVSESDSGCESPRAPVIITVNPKPVPPAIIDNPGLYCPGQAFVPFTVVSGINILWYSAATGGSGSTSAPFLSTVNPGAFPVWASQTVLGCESDRTESIVTVYDSVKAGFGYTVNYGCHGDTVIFNSTSWGTNFNSWVFGDGYNSIVINPTHVYLLQDDYQVTLYSSSANCIDSAKQLLHLNYPLFTAFTASPLLLCQGGTVSFTDSSTATSPHHAWYYADGGQDTGATQTHNYTRTGVYNAFEVVTDTVNCSDTAYHTIYVDSLSPVSVAITDTAFCVGTYVTFTGTYTSIGDTSIIWSFGNGDTLKDVNPIKYAFNQAGVYTITATPLYRICADPTATRTITIQAQPSIDLGHDTSICKGSGALILRDDRNSGTPGATWKWSTGQTSSSIAVTQPGEYSATVRIGGCTAASTINVANDCYMNVPNIFTPNGDGVNDYFYPRQYLTSGLISFKMDIYNRWGQLVFETTTLDGRGWDGKLNSADQPEGVYVFVIDGTFKDGQQEHHQGNVTLLR